MNKDELKPFQDLLKDCKEMYKLALETSKDEHLKIETRMYSDGRVQATLEVIDKLEVLVAHHMLSYKFKAGEFVYIKNEGFVPARAALIDSYLSGVVRVEDDGFPTRISQDKDPDCNLWAAHTINLPIPLKRAFGLRSLTFREENLIKIEDQEGARLMWELQTEEFRKNA